MKKIIVLFSFLLLSFIIQAQDTAKPTYNVTGTYLGKTKAFKDLPTVKEPEKRQSSRSKIIRNRMRAARKVNDNALPLNGDRNAQLQFGSVNTLALEQNFPGANINEGGAVPPDPTGAVGPNHYVHAFNLGIKIFDKSGNLLYGPISLGDFFQNGVNNGDPIVLYDQLADRYFISQFRVSNNALLIAVSETPDPTGVYNMWEFPLNSFPDYPHYTVWHNAYFMTANKNGLNTYAFDREAMLAGDTNPQLIGFTLPGITNNPNTVFSPEPANLLGTTFDANTPGYVVYLQDDGWGGGILQDHLKIWEVDLDWNTPSNSVINAPLIINTQPFESTFAPFGTGDVNQPGTSQKLDMIGGVISYMTNYRRFGTHNSMIVTFNADVNGNDRSGVRWFELRNDDTNPWSIYQEGTYAPNDGLSRFMGSAAIDAQGNIGLAFNVASATTPVGIRYTGRFNGDPLGQMTVAETTIIDGVGVQTNTNRFGDYSHLTMDVDNFTFWHTAEYFSANNFWNTRVASFRLSGGFENDLGVANIITPNDGILSATEPVEITLRNYGTLPQSNFNIELRVDGNLIATETYSGTLASNEIDNFTFLQTANLSSEGQTYELSATVILASDQFLPNNTFVKEVQHLLSNDLGVTSIDAPSSGEGLGNETVGITIQNFGALPQSNFNVSYTVNGGTPVVETVTATINPSEELNYNFTQTADLSQLGSYDFVASTLLTNDQDITNNSSLKTVEHLACEPSSNCDFGDGFVKFQIGTIDNVSSCSPDGYGDFTNLNASLSVEVPIDVTVASGYDDQLFSVFIDFNDNFVFEESELVITDVAIPSENTNVTVSFTLPDDSAIAGTHLLRARASWSESDPTSADACVDFTYGETEDYTVTIETTLSTESTDFNNASFTIYPISDRNYEVNFSGTANFGDLEVEVYNAIGQVIFKQALNQNGTSYKTVLNFQNQASGVYLAKVFNGNFSTVKKLVVN